MRKNNLDNYQKYIYKSRYARWLPEENRREDWEETIARYCDFFRGRNNLFPYGDVYNSIVGMDVMPSMRALMSAGEALTRDNLAGYNCAALAITSPDKFAEIMFLLMNGTGVGYSVERQYVNQLPSVPQEILQVEDTITVADSKEGWAAAFREFLSLLYLGKAVRFDCSQVRAAGTRLKTFGGRASGPDPLQGLQAFTVALFKKAVGRKLTSVECSDLACKIATAIICGGTRRSALICLSNLTDERMRNYKHGRWWDEAQHRALANISTAYTENPDIGIFMKEWHALYESKSGERGIFNRVAAKKQVVSTKRRDSTYDFLTNP